MSSAQTTAQVWRNMALDVQAPPVDPILAPRPARSRAAGPRWARLADIAIAIVVLAVSAVVLLRAVETVPFHGDESEWISAGRYFRFVFLDHDLTSQVWRESWLNRDQPPVGRYIIGGIVWSSGTDPARVNRTYAWERDYEANLREGRVPDRSILLPVRRTMALVGAGSIMLLYVAGRLVGGRVVGVVAAALATASPLLQSYFVQARTEALLAFFTALALVALLLFARRYQRDGTIGPAAWTVGPLLGLALAIKLTAAVAIVGVCAYGGWAALARLRNAPRESVILMLWTGITGLAACLVWVGVNPFLWPDPLGRTWSMLEQQQSIMVEQGTQFGNPVELALPGRLLLLIERTFAENSTPAFDYGAPRGSDPLIRPTFTSLPKFGGISVELVLAAIGLTVPVRQTVTAWRSGGRHGPESVLLWWLMAYWLGIGVNLSLDWPRYYVPTAFFGSILIGLGVQAIIALVAGRRAGTQHGALGAPVPSVKAAG
jgi:hypothetical protein